ncbi:MAG: tripartite tricarboxylate transporter TctB family protein [Gammaproteobacteria bacterium]
MTRAGRDVVLGLCLIAVALAGWFVVIPLGIDLPKNLKLAALSPDFWPRIVMIILALSGASVAVQAWVENRKPAPATSSADDTDAHGPIVEHRACVRALRVVFAFACLFAFYFAIPYLGVIAGSTIIIVVYGAMLGQRSWVRLGLLAAVLPAALYLFFAHVAQIPMPLGVFETLR